MRALELDLERRRQAGLYRRRRIIDTAQGVETVVDGKPVISFCGNDYLGLASHPEVRQVFVEAAAKYGVGSGAAHLINGHSRLHEECELRLAEFTGRDRALLFSAGYMANLAIPGALLGRKDLVVQDKLNHASLIDAAQLCGARFQRYAHGDLPRLETILSENNDSVRKLIMTDSVFSMDGDCADVKAMSDMAARHEAWLMVDDAHGFGVLGAHGAGLLELLQLDQEQVPILMATLGKAIGTAGAFVAGSEALIEALIQQARPYIYTTAQPPAIAAATIKAIELVQSETWRRQKLQESIAYFRTEMLDLGLQLANSQTAIQPIVVGDNHRALEWSETLFHQGIHVAAIRPPTVPEGSARLRVTLSASHDRKHIERLVKAFRRLGQQTIPQK